MTSSAIAATSPGANTSGAIVFSSPGNLAHGGAPAAKKDQSLCPEQEFLTIDGFASITHLPVLTSKDFAK